jgi:hypothetical protein
LLLRTSKREGRELLVHAP